MSPGKAKKKGGPGEPPFENQLDPRQNHSGIAFGYFDDATPTPFSLSFAWAAAMRAMGTRKGEQLT